ncbi:hypothetical protein [Ectobacillus funiculus]|uniref:Group-specific protein n=1 Tax=Ectobacillus funiculus TaxID=137993 RepID=A0ABV5W9B5_9BACI
MKKFLLSYIMCLVYYSLLLPATSLIIHPEDLTKWWDPFPFDMIILYIMFGGIPTFIICLIGEILYRTIRKIYKLQVGVPVFLLLGVFYTLLMGEDWFSAKEYIYESIPIALASLAFYLTRRSGIQSH